MIMFSGHPQFFYPVILELVILTNFSPELCMCCNLEKKISDAKHSELGIKY